MAIELEQAQEMVRASVTHCCEAEDIGIEQLHGRICARDITSPLDLPPFNRSPLDGYALRAADSAGACAQNCVELDIIESIVAGQWPQKCVTPGTAIRLMTGSPIPKGADCVIRQENVEEKDSKVRIATQLTPFENFCPKGEDITNGALLVSEGESLSYIHVGILAGAGFDTVPVYRKPRVVLLETGDELWHPKKGALPAGKIYASNSILLSCRLRELGAYVTRIGQCKDDKFDIAKKIEEAVTIGDILITTGGVSVGCKDLLPDAIEYLGADTIFHGINIKPGTPALFSVYKELPILALSGNPFAAITTMELLARPALALMGRNKNADIIYTEGILENDFPKPSPGRRFVRGTQKNGYVHIADGLHSSGALGSMKGCNCLVDIPAGSGALKSGERVRFVEVN